MAPGKVCLCLLFILVLCSSLAFGMVERPTPTPPPVSVLTRGVRSAPVILSSGRDTTWIQVHNDSTYCPGDPNWGHCGEATGIHSVEWDGLNSKGERVTSGVYFYKIDAGAFTATRKMLVLR